MDKLILKENFIRLLMTARRYVHSIHLSVGERWTLYDDLVAATHAFDGYDVVSQVTGSCPICETGERKDHHKEETNEE